MSAHWDEKRASTGREQRAKCVISLGEACHFHTGGSPDMKGDGGRRRGREVEGGGEGGGTTTAALCEDVKAM